MLATKFGFGAHPHTLDPKPARIVSHCDTPIPCDSYPHIICAIKFPLLPATTAESTFGPPDERGEKHGVKREPDKQLAPDDGFFRVATVVRILAASRVPETHHLPSSRLLFEISQLLGESEHRRQTTGVNEDNGFIVVEAALLNLVD